MAHARKHRHSLPRPVSGYEPRVVDGELLLYHTGRAQGVYLNDSAHIIWNLCHRDMDLESIVEALFILYPESRQKIRADVSLALDCLCEQGVIYWDDHDPLSE